ncbi:Gfo/Idh/MocA family protein [Hyphococcus sp.]|uniref:Gfo/Idh/MocA family protein n=1 Tax=Hyphococcus sp. TaxID=2038636 RepID=UPI003CCC2FAC
MTKIIKVGVAGAGVFGGYHASKYARNAQAPLTAVYDPDAQRAVALAGKHNVEAISDFEDLLAATDAIIVAAPATAHFEIACAALKAQKHVFIEKPITLNVADADTLIDLASENNAVLQVGHQERYVFEAAGLFGRSRAPLKIDSVRSAAGSGRCEDVSVVLDLLIHDIDLVRHLSQAEISSLSAKGGDHEASAELGLTNGSVVSLMASRRTPAPERRMTLVYDDGVIEFDFLRRRVSNSTPAILQPEMFADAPTLAFSDPLAFGANEFIANIMNGRTPTVSGRDGREALRWALRIEQAAGIAGQTPEVKENLERRRA